MATTNTRAKRTTKRKATKRKATKRKASKRPSAISGIAGLPQVVGSLKKTVKVLAGEVDKMKTANRDHRAINRDQKALTGTMARMLGRTAKKSAAKKSGARIVQMPYAA